MIDVNLKLTLDKITVDEKEVINKESIPLNEMENWLELFYENEEYEDEEVDVTVDIE